MNAWARVVGRVLALGGVVLLTADHGNADMMQNPDGSPMTAHTTNRVPVLSIWGAAEASRGRLLSATLPPLFWNCSALIRLPK